MLVSDMLFLIYTFDLLCHLCNVLVPTFLPVPVPAKYINSLPSFQLYFSLSVSQRHLCSFSPPSSITTLFLLSQFQFHPCPSFPTPPPPAIFTFFPTPASFIPSPPHLPLRPCSLVQHSEIRDINRSPPPTWPHSMTTRRRG